MRTSTVTVAVVGLGLLGPGLASTEATAHPHVWIDDVTTFVFEDGALTGLRHRWVFDAFFSSYVIEAHDQNGDGTLQDGEVETVFAGAFSSLADFGYFTQVRIDGEPVAVASIEGFEAWIEDEALVYEFTARLPEPVDPVTSSVSAGVFDPEYYVEVLLDETDPVRFEGLPSGACAFAIREDTENPIYYGMVFPLTIRLQCVTS